MGAKKSRALRDNSLPWASIDAYPEWIAALLSNYKARRRGLRDGRRRLFLRGACTRAPRARGGATANAAAHGVDQARRHWSDGGSPTAPPAPPPRAHNCRASAHVYATGDCGDERQRQWRRRSGGGRFFFGFGAVPFFLNPIKLHSGRHCLRHTTANRRETQFRAEPTPGRFLRADPR